MYVYLDSAKTYKKYHNGAGKENDMTKDLLQGSARLKNMYFSPIRQVSERAQTLAADGKPVLFFSTGEPDFDTPTPIREAAIQALRNNRTHYAPNRGTLPLRQAISQRLAQDTGVEYDPADEILVHAGGAEALNNAMLALIDPGDEVIVFSPAYMNYDNLISLCGAVMVSIPLQAERGFQVNLDELRRRITRKTRMIILNNPCNPTGIVFRQEILEGICALAREHNLLLMSDEIYSSIVYDQISFHSAASFPGMKERTILVNGFSKTYAMTGWRLGYTAARPELIQQILKVHQYTTTCCPTFIQDAAADAMNLSETQEEVKKMVAAFDHRRRVMMAGLDQIPGITYTRPQGAFYLFADVSGLGISGDEFAARMLEEQYVACVPGSKLGDSSGKFVRFSYATGDDAINEGLQRIANFAGLLAK